MSAEAGRLRDECARLQAEVARLRRGEGGGWGAELGSLLRGAFAVITLLIGVKMLYPRSAEWRLGDDLPKNPALFVYGWLIGLLSGLIGIGGGTLNNVAVPNGVVMISPSATSPSVPTTPSS